MKVLDDFRRNVATLLEFFDAHEYIAIYGAGANGCGVTEVLKYYGKKPNAFIISDGQTIPERPDNIPIYHLSDFNGDPDKCGIILSLDWSHHTAVCPALEKRGFFTIFPKRENRTSHDAHANIVAIMHSLHILTNLDNFQFESDFWNVKGCRLPNVYRLTHCQDWEPASELHGFVLPALGYDFPTGPEGPYEQGAVVLDEGDIVFDCGANYGFFSAVAAFRGCTVHAFEPSPRNRLILEETRRIYPNNIISSPYALSDVNGKAQLDETEKSLTAHLLPEKSPDGVGIEITTITIDRYVKDNALPRVDFIKADIEGAERKMLSGAQETLARFAPKLAICTYHYPDDREVLTKIIHNANPMYKIEYGSAKLYAAVPKD